MLIHEYETFKMKEEENIEDAIERFSKVFNGLNMLGKKFSEKEIIRMGAKKSRWYVDSGCSKHMTASFDSLNLDGEEKEKETNEASTQETKGDEEVQIIEPSMQGQSNELPKE
ncbi:hypothetical protein PIB30_049986 [Stylosanthes scabra]|uniref:Uncharacterized protein n=1 Tax=Stylosanthes scabra TaxID=79078 RepID=A0ABU6RI74_9FABA|nr:hypothetical protein [Stylosanthes scabra]